MFQFIFWITIILLLCFIIFECLPSGFVEGFQGEIMSVGDSAFWTRLVPRRGDIGPEQEQDGYTRDKHYFSGYVDVQRFGTATDFCRMVERKGDDPKQKFIACALGGTENLTSIGFRTSSVKDGFRLSRDDYMRDIDSDGRADYCRILKQGEEFQALCNLSTETGFSKKEVVDNNPPEDIVKLLHMYDGCMFWLRLRDDMLDYIQNLYVNKAGGCEVDEETPNPPVTLGLPLNGMNQYLRIGDDSYLNFGSDILLRNMKAVHIWVKFDEFTNNAHIFDFGNGAGIDNVWLGILHRGNLGVDASTKKPLLCGGDSTVPEAPSGAQPGYVTTPQDLMETTSANVEEFTCEGFAVSPKVVKHRVPNSRVVDSSMAKTADMVYEIWDSQQRKMRIVIPGMFTINEWVHVVITAEGTDAFRPDIVVYKNGERIYIEPSGWLPQNNETQKNYIGKSNWSNVTSQYANRDELFKGSIFDFRGYKVPLSPSVITESYVWGKKMLGI
jgi:hypothetical protein